MEIWHNSFYWKYSTTHFVNSSFSPRGELGQRGGANKYKWRWTSTEGHFSNHIDFFSDSIIQVN